MPANSVLIVDDEESILFILEDFLSGLGFRTHVCPTLQAARELLEREPVVAVLSDVTLPDGNGMDFYSSVQKQHPQLAQRFILMTGFDLDADLEEFLNEHHIPFLQKPFRLDQLQSAVKEVLGRNR